MLVGIGPRSESQDLVDLLAACHARIRRFLALAGRIATELDRSHAEIIEACQQCRRYFTEALPLHVEDEDQSLMPRLSMLGGVVADALAQMHAQHRSHEPLLAVFLDALAAVVEAPGAPEARRILAVATHTLEPELEAHLQLEEQTIFPAIRQHMTVEDRAAVVEELRARRR